MSAAHRLEIATPASTSVSMPPRLARGMQQHDGAGERARECPSRGRASGNWPTMRRCRARSLRRARLRAMTPTTPGSASGLRNRPCSAAPAMPSVMPTSIASSGARQAHLAHDHPCGVGPGRAPSCRRVRTCPPSRGRRSSTGKPECRPAATRPAIKQRIGQGRLHLRLLAAAALRAPDQDFNRAENARRAARRE
jgi:hypothetical protein